jgi:hypothetical protein
MEIVSDTLSTSNPFVRNPADRRREVFASVASSSAIEGIFAPFRKTAKAGKSEASKIGRKCAEKLKKSAARRAPSARSR